MAIRQVVDRKETLIGRTDTGRVTWPTIRGSKRRNDPDGGSATAYFPGLNGTSLTIAILGSVTLVLTANFVSNDYTAALAVINGLSPADIKADDDNGYLRITNLNGGRKNQLIIGGGTAAPILGFEIDPMPGSSSVAGELPTTGTGWPQQNNDQSSRLISYDEGLNSISINRAIAGVATMFDSIVANMDREIAYPKRIEVEVVNGVFTMPPANDTDKFYIGGTTTPNPSLDVLDKIITFMDVTDDQVFVNDTRVRVQSATYGPLVNDAQSFTSWTVSDGKSVFGPGAHWLKTKTTASITAIKGNVLTVPGGLFLTRNVRSGDTLIISSATNNNPFNHNGDFIVDEVYDENHVSVRPKGLTDVVFDSTNSPPSSLNITREVGELYGIATVIVGKFIPFILPAARISFKLNLIPPDGTYRVLVSVGKTLRTILPEEISLATIYKEFGKQIELGSKLQANLDAEKPRIMARASANNPATLLGEFPGNNNTFTRWYITRTGGFFTTHNAKWSQGSFTKDTNDISSYMFSSIGLIARFASKKDADNAAWVDWDEVMSLPQNRDLIQDAIVTGNGIKIGETIVGDATTALIPRVQYNTRNTDYTQLTKSTRGTLSYREYSTPFGETSVYNGEWDGTKWVREDTTVPTVKLVKRPTGLIQYSYGGALPSIFDNQFSARDDNFNYILDEDWLITDGTDQDNTVIFNTMWKSGVLLNSSIGVNNANTCIGALDMSSKAGGPFNTSMTFENDVPVDVNSFIIKARIAVYEPDDISGEGIFIGLKDGNNMFLGMRSGGSSWSLRKGPSNALVDIALGAITPGTHYTITIERFGTTVNAYVNDILAGTTQLTYTFTASTKLWVICNGNATIASTQITMDYLKFWMGRPH